MNTQDREQKANPVIYKLTFEDGRIDWCTAPNLLSLLKSYDEEQDLDLQQLSDLKEISEEEAKTTIVNNTEYDENDPEDFKQMSLFDLAVGEGYAIIASTEYE